MHTEGSRGMHLVVRVDAAEATMANRLASTPADGRRTTMLRRSPALSYLLFLLLFLLSLLSFPYCVSSLAWDRSTSSLLARSEFVGNFVPIRQSCNDSLSNPMKEDTNMKQETLCRTIQMIDTNQSRLIMIAFGGERKSVGVKVNDLSVTLWPIPGLESSAAGKREGWVSLTDSVKSSSAMPLARNGAASAWLPALPQIVFYYGGLGSRTDDPNDGSRAYSSLWVFDVSDIGFRALGPTPVLPSDYVATSAAHLLSINTTYIDAAPSDIRTRCAWPTPRYYHSMVVMDTSLLVFGGLSTVGGVTIPSSDLWILTINATVVDLIKLQNGPGKYERGFVYDTSTDSQCVPWRKWVAAPWPAACNSNPSHAAPTPGARFNHAATSSNNEMFILGGSGARGTDNKYSSFADLWIFRLASDSADPARGSWRQVTLITPPDLTGFTRRAGANMITLQSGPYITLIGGTLDANVDKPIVSDVVALGLLEPMRSAMAQREATFPDFFRCEPILTPPLNYTDPVSMPFERRYNLTSPNSKFPFQGALLTTPVESNLMQHVWIGGVDYVTVNGQPAVQDTSIIQSYSEWTSTSEVVQLVPPHWGSVSTNKPNPLAQRHLHRTAVLDNQLWVYGGLGEAEELLSDMWLYDLASDSWEEITFTGDFTPVPHQGMTMVAHAETKSLWVYGGYADLYWESVSDYEIMRFDTVSRSWELLETASRIIYNETSGTPVNWQSIHGYTPEMAQAKWPPARGIRSFGWQSFPYSRAYHTAVVIGDLMYAYAGLSPYASTLFGCLWSLNLTSLVWDLTYYAPDTVGYYLLPDGVPDLRSDHLMELLPGGTQLVIGLGNMEFSLTGRKYSDLWIFDLPTSKWSKVTPAQTSATGPTLAFAASCILNQRLYVHGGRTQDVDLSAALYSFDFTLNRWASLTAPTVGGTMPTGRAGSSMNAMKVGGTEFCIGFGGLTSDFVLGIRIDISNELHLLTDDQVDVGSRIGLDILGGFSFPAPPAGSELAAILAAELGDSNRVTVETARGYFSLPFARLAAAVGVFQRNTFGRAQFNILSSSTPPSSADSSSSSLSSSSILHARSLMAGMETLVIKHAFDFVGQARDAATTTIACMGTCMWIARAAEVSEFVTIKNMILIGRNLTGIILPVDAPAQSRHAGYSGVTVSAGSAVALIDCSLLNHTSGWFGSAMSIVASELLLLRVNVSGCSASLNGGAIWGVASIVNSIESTFTHNRIDTSSNNLDKLNTVDMRYDFIAGFYRDKQCTLNQFDEAASSDLFDSSIPSTFVVGFISCFGYGGAIHLLASSLHLYSSVLSSNFALFGGGFALDSNMPVRFGSSANSVTALILTGSTFARNSAAQFGAAAFLNEYPWTSEPINDATFRGNIAPYGVIYSHYSSDINCTDLHFDSNMVQAGQIFWTANADRLLNGQNKQNPPILGNITATGNTYVYGPIIASIPARIFFIDANESILAAPSSFISIHAGADIDPPLRIGLFDLHGQLVRTENSVFIAAAPGAALGGITVVQVVGGIATFSALQLLLYPTLTVNITFTASTTLPLYDATTTTLPLESRPCGPGEYVTAKKCVACSAGRYSNVTMAVECQPCDPGWWQGSEGATECIPCPIGSATARIGDTQCAQCPVASHAWTSGLSTCTPCGVGLKCENGTATPIKGYWLARAQNAHNNALAAVVDTPTGTEYLYVIPCPGDACGSNGECSGNRINPPDLNPLCAACMAGYTTVDDSCVQCDGVNGGLVFAALLLALLIAIVVYQLANVHSDRDLHGARSDKADTPPSWLSSLFSIDCSDEVITILAFFVQSFTFEVGSISQATAWLRLIGFNITAVSSSTCFFPTDAYGNLFLHIASPFVIVLFLILGMVCHRALWLPAVLSRFAMRRSKLNATLKKELHAKLRLHERQATTLQLQPKFDRDLASLRIKFQVQDSSSVDDLHAHDTDSVASQEATKADVVETERIVQMRSLTEDPFVFALFGHTLPVRVNVPRFSKTRYIRSACLICVLIYQPVSVTVLSHLNCTSIGDARLVFNSATIDCDSFAYKYRALPVLALMTVLWVFGLPLLVFLLWWKRKRLERATTITPAAITSGVRESDTPIPEASVTATSRPPAASSTPIVANSRAVDRRIVFERRFGHIFRRFRSSVPWWQALILSRTVLILVVDLALFSEPQYKMTVFTNFMAILLFIHLWVRPYAATLPNILESITLLFLTIVNAIALAQISYFQLPGSGSSVSEDAYTPAVKVLMVCFTLPIVIGLLLVIVRLKWPRFLGRLRHGCHRVGRWWSRRRGAREEFQRELKQLESAHQSAVTAAAAAAAKPTQPPSAALPSYEDMSPFADSSAYRNDGPTRALEMGPLPTRLTTRPPAHDSRPTQPPARPFQLAGPSSTPPPIPVSTNDHAMTNGTEVDGDSSSGSDTDDASDEEIERTIEVTQTSEQRQASSIGQTIATINEESHLPNSSTLTAVTHHRHADQPASPSAKASSPSSDPPPLRSHTRRDSYTVSGVVVDMPAAYDDEDFEGHHPPPPPPPPQVEL